MDNLNDNINLEFLSNKLQKFGEWDSLAIDYHPVTKKHLGLARVMFKLVGSAVACVAALHGRSMMGKQVGGNFFFSMSFHFPGELLSGSQRVDGHQDV